MMNSRKKLIAKIALEEKAIVYYQCQINMHKNYFKNDVYGNKLIPLGIILSSFIGGFTLARKKWIGQTFKGLVEIGMVAVTTHFKNQLLRTLIP